MTTIPVTASSWERDTLSILVDYSNLELSSNDDSAGRQLGQLIEKSVYSLIGLSDFPSQVNVRLYGGWLERSELSRDGSRALQLIRMLNLFPLSFRGRVLRGTISLATSLLACPTIEFGDTFVQRRAPYRLRIRQEGMAGCVDQEGCPIRSLAKLTESSTRSCSADTCPVTSGPALARGEQKMVDTMLASDILYLVHEQSVRGVAVISGDADLVPPMVQAGTAAQTQVVAIDPDELLGADLRMALNDRGVAYLTLSE